MDRRLAVYINPAGDLNMRIVPRPLYFRVGVPSRRPGPPPLPIYPAQVRNLHEEPLVSVQLQDTQQVDLTVEARDAAGNVVPNPGTLTWTVDDDTVLVVAVNPDDPAKANVATTGKLGVATVTVSDDTDGDTATAEAVGSLSFEVVTGAVTQITVTAGDPYDRPVTPPTP